jgi:hypothetical protein
MSRPLVNKLNNAGCHSSTPPQHHTTPSTPEAQPACILPPPRNLQDASSSEQLVNPWLHTSSVTMSALCMQADVSDANLQRVPCMLGHPT